MGQSRRSIEQAMARMGQFWPQMHLPTVQIMLRIYRLRDIALRQASAGGAEKDISASELDVLAALRATAPGTELRPSQLLESLMLTSGGLTKVLHGLERKGLIVRAAQSADRRTRPVRLSAQRIAVAEAAFGAILMRETAIFNAAITGEEQAALLTLLDKLLDGFDAAASD